MAISLAWGGQEYREATSGALVPVRDLLGYLRPPPFLRDTSPLILQSGPCLDFFFNLISEQDKKNRPHAA